MRCDLRGAAAVMTVIFIRWKEQFRMAYCFFFGWAIVDCRFGNVIAGAQSCDIFGKIVYSTINNRNKLLNHICLNFAYKSGSVVCFSVPETTSPFRSEIGRSQ